MAREWGQCSGSAQPPRSPPVLVMAGAGAGAAGVAGAAGAVIELRGKRAADETGVRRGGVRAR